MTRRPMNGARRNTSDTAEHAQRGVGPATDYGADEGEPIYAPFSGYIGEWWSDTGGNTIQVRGTRRTMLGQHLSSYAVSTGQWVNEGDLIGYVGSTGSATDGPHLHWWVEDNGVRISGETYMYRAGLGYTPYGSRTPNTSSSGGGTTPYPEDDMFDDKDRQDLKLLLARVNATFSGIYGPRNETGDDTPLSWVNVGGHGQTALYGLLPIVIETQVRLDAALTQIAALQQQPSGSGTSVDLSAITSAITDLTKQIADNFSAVTANLNEIPVGFTPITRN